MIFRSPLPDLTFPDPMPDFSSFVLARGRTQPDKIAFVDAHTGKRVTFGEFIRAVETIASALVARGLRPGDIVALCGFNAPEFGIAAHSVWRAGGIVLTINPLFTAREMEHELAEARPRFAFTGPEVVDRMAQAIDSAGVGTRILVMSDQPVADMPSLLSLAAEGGTPPVLTVDAARDTALILYSSGTTGLPKGVMLTHRNLIAQTLQHIAGDLSRSTDVLLGLSPFFHIVGLAGILNLGLYTGATTVTMRRYDLESVLRLAAEERLSSLFVTPPVLLDFVKNPMVDLFDLSSFRSVLCAAAPLGGELEQAAADRLGCVVRQGYGMTEATGPITTTLCERIRRGAVGEVVPSTECKIVSLEDGRELGPDALGEVMVRGPQVMHGYLNNPQATAHTLEPDGWLHTGDVGAFDADGYLRIVDRVKEIIKYKAYQVAPAELEGVLLTHPAVADAAVIPSPDAAAGEVPKALVVIRSGADVSRDELLAYVAERVAPYKKVRLLEMVEAIPKSPSGKILRRVLIEAERNALPAR
jgi:acyl-CoA synthetase (AMP-forming)/AMP-acid ligase II